jgi:hypothetical protein
MALDLKLAFESFTLYRYKCQNCQAVKRKKIMKGAPDDRIAGADKTKTGNEVSSL